MKKSRFTGASRTSAQGALHSMLPSGYYWLMGVHPVQMALDNPQRHKSVLLGTAQALAKLTLPKSKPIHSKIVTQEELAKLVPQGAVHQGVLLAVQPLTPLALSLVLEQEKPLVMLDQVTDPQNIGAILRSAAAFGAGAVIVQEKHSPVENATIAKIAAGALEVVPYLMVTNLSRTIEEVQKAGYWVVGLDGKADKPLAECGPGKKTMLVMGAEGAGLRRLVAEHCDVLTKLPIQPQMESLNVSVAAGIALYEICRS